MTKKSRLQCRAFIALAVAGFIAAGCGLIDTASRTLVYRDVTIDGESGYEIKLRESRDYLSPSHFPVNPTFSKDADYGPMTIITPDGTETVLQNDHPDFSKIFAFLKVPTPTTRDQWLDYKMDKPVNIPFAVSPVISPD